MDDKNTIDMTGIDEDLTQRALDLTIQQVPVIITTIDANGMVIVHRPGCAHIAEQQPFRAALPKPEKIKECSCMPSLQAAIDSLRATP